MKDNCNVRESVTSPEARNSSWRLFFHFRAFEHFIDLGFVFQHCLSEMFQLALLNLIFTLVFKVTAEKSGFEGSEHAISSRQKILLK